MNNKKFEKGDQIAYIPDHAEGDLNHRDVEFGFVVSEQESGNAVFCRYWNRGTPGILRTVSNSELTPRSNLVLYRSVAPYQVEIYLKSLEGTTNNDQTML